MNVSMDVRTPVTITPEEYDNEITIRHFCRYLSEHPYKGAAYTTLKLSWTAVKWAGFAGMYAGYYGCRSVLVGSGAVIGGTTGLVAGISQYREGQPLGRTLREYSIAGMEKAGTGAWDLLACFVGAGAFLGTTALVSAGTAYYAGTPVLGTLGIATALFGLDLSVNKGLEQSVTLSVLSKMQGFETDSFIYDSCDTPVGPLKTLSEAIDYLRQQAGMENASSDMISLNDQLSSLDEYESRELWRFLRQLVSTDEFNHSLETRGIVSARILYILAVSLNSPTLKEQAMIRIHDSLAGCQDHVLLALSDLQVAVFVYQLEETIPAEMAEEHLLQLAKKMFILDKIRSYSVDFQSRKELPRPGGHIEVENVFHISLAESYGLPVSIRRLASPGKRRVAMVTEQDINELKNFLDLAYTTEFDQFLENWLPWKKNQRKLSVMRYELLDQVPFQQDMSQCLITLEEADDLVYLNGSPYSYSELKKWYICEGTDPLTRGPMCWGDVNRVQRYGAVIFTGPQ